MSEAEHPNFVTLAIKLPEGIEIKLGSEIEVQGQKVTCQSISWGINSCLEAAALEQRLEVALNILQWESYTEKYEEQLEELREVGDLIELKED